MMKSNKTVVSRHVARTGREYMDCVRELEA